jgi:hypothetical protein
VVPRVWWSSELLNKTETSALLSSTTSTLKTPTGRPQDVNDPACPDAQRRGPPTLGRQVGAVEDAVSPGRYSKRLRSTTQRIELLFAQAIDPQCHYG